MSNLTRTAVGHLSIESAVAPAALSRETIEPYLLPPLEAVRGLTVVQLTAHQLQLIAHGQTISLPQQTAQQLAAVTPGGDLAAVLTRRDERLYCPRLNFVASSTTGALNLTD
jgi:tRNA U55 pseudouridine synthase TruB